jgi:DNA-directed RNA polymerase specialized sigma24 family protein
MLDEGAIFYTLPLIRLAVHEVLSEGESVELAELRADTAAALAQLSQRHRAVIYLRWAGYSLAEIAERVSGKRNRKTGNSLVKRAEQRLLRLMNGGGGDENVVASDLPHHHASGVADVRVGQFDRAA